MSTRFYDDFMHTPNIGHSDPLNNHNMYNPTNNFIKHKNRSQSINDNVLHDDNNFNEKKIGEINKIAEKYLMKGDLIKSFEIYEKRIILHFFVKFS